jgi:hypothetical protein
MILRRFWYQFDSGDRRDDINRDGSGRMYPAPELESGLGAIRGLIFLAQGSKNYVNSSICQDGIIISHLDEAHRYQLL